MSRTQTATLQTPNDPIARMNPEKLQALLQKLNHNPVNQQLLYNALLQRGLASQFGGDAMLQAQERLKAVATKGLVAQKHPDTRWSPYTSRPSGQKQYAQQAPKPPTAVDIAEIENRKAKLQADFVTLRRKHNYHNERAKEVIQGMDFIKSEIVRCQAVIAQSKSQTAVLPPVHPQRQMAPLPILNSQLKQELQRLTQICANSPPASQPSLTAQLAPQPPSPVGTQHRHNTTRADTSASLGTALANFSPENSLEPGEEWMRQIEAAVARLEKQLGVPSSQAGEILGSRQASPIAHGIEATTATFADPVTRSSPASSPRPQCSLQTLCEAALTASAEEEENANASDGAHDEVTAAIKSRTSSDANTTQA